MKELNNRFLKNLIYFLNLIDLNINYFKNIKTKVKFLNI